MPWLSPVLDAHDRAVVVALEQVHHLEVQQLVVAHAEQLARLDGGRLECTEPVVELARRQLIDVLALLRIHALDNLRHERLVQDLGRELCERRRL